MAVKFILAGLYLMLAAAAQASDDTVSATILWYAEQEPGIDPYRVRYIVTPDFLRSDDGAGSDDYLLFDRKKESVYSVVAENRTILQVDGGVDLAAVPPELVLNTERHVDAKAPEVGGGKPVTLELSAAGEVCRSAIVAEGFLDEERKVFREFARVIAGQQARTMNNTPAELRTPCFLARYLYAFDFHLAEGIVLAEWSPNGERRELVDIEKQVAVPLSLFVIPDDYAVMRAAGR